jgi:hypothetical protein
MENPHTLLAAFLRDGKVVDTVMFTMPDELFPYIQRGYDDIQIADLMLTRWYSPEKVRDILDMTYTLLKKEHETRRKNRTGRKAAGGKRLSHHPS